MKAWDYNAVVVDGCSVYCVECLPAALTAGSEGVYPIFVSDEMDSFPTCDACGKEHDYMGLTTCGEEIRAALLAGRDW